MNHKLVDQKKEGELMNLAIGTDYEGRSKRIEDIEMCLREIAEAGFSHVHWCFEWTGDYIYSKAEMYQIREWMEKYGLKAKSLHASNGSNCGDTSKKDIIEKIIHRRWSRIELQEEN